MPKFTALSREVRLEFMRPAQIDAARAERPAIYLAVGSIEWHGRHNPIGVDGLCSHDVLVELALQAGGVVYPPVFFGCGGGHARFPYTMMVESDAMTSIVLSLLRGFERNGFTTVILLAGHFPNNIPPTNFLSQAADAYRADGGTMRILPFIYWMAGLHINHADNGETSLTMNYYPETVDMREIAGPTPEGLPEPEDNWMADIYRDHPCYGICKPDPRGVASADIGQAEVDKIVSLLHDWLDRIPEAIAHFQQYREFSRTYE